MGSQGQLEGCESPLEGSEGLLEGSTDRQKARERDRKCEIYRPPTPNLVSLATTVINNHEKESFSLSEIVMKK